MDFIREYLPWLLSAITCYMTLMVGNKRKHAWTLGIANQLLWLLWIVVAQAWGLLPMTAMLTIIYFRNYFRWKRESIVQTTYPD